MLAYLLLAHCALSPTPAFAPSPSCQVKEASYSEDAFFAPDQLVTSAHYLLCDQRGPEAAHEASDMLELAFRDFEKLLGSAPNLRRDDRLRVEILRDEAQWTQRLESLQIPTDKNPHPAHYARHSRTALLFVQPTAYATRAYLLQAALRQFHHNAKSKNDDLVNHWFVGGLAEKVAMHRWDGEKLEIAAQLRLAPIDTPALALEAFKQRPAHAKRFTEDFLQRTPISWALISFLMDGAGGKHRKRFHKLVLGKRGSMIDGVQLAHSLGKPDRIAGEIEAWLHSAQLPIAVAAGDFVDYGDGLLVGRARRGNSALAARRAPAKKLHCYVELDGRAAAGLILDFSAIDDYTYAAISNGRLSVVRIIGTEYETLSDFPSPPFRRGQRIELAAERKADRVELLIEGISMGWVETRSDRLGLFVQEGEGRFTEVEWE